MKLEVFRSPIEHTVRLPRLAQQIQDAFKADAGKLDKRQALAKLQDMERTVLALYEHLA